jgi:MFS transporter, DHA1 family, multidrug resistance protein
MELWKKNLYTIWVAQFITIMGMSAVVPFLPFYVRTLGVTDPDLVARWSGFAFSGPFFLSLFFTPFWGMVGDKYGRKLMVIRAVFGLGIAQLLVGNAQTVEQLIFFRMIQGALSGFIPAALTLVSATAPRERTGFALGFLQTSLSAGMLIGPVLGGALADVFGYRVIFYIVAALCFCSGIFVIVMVKEIPQKQQKEKYTLRDNYRFAFSSFQISVAMVLIYLAQTSMIMLQPIFALFIEDLYTDTQYVSTVTGALFSVVGLIMIFSAPWWGNRTDLGEYKRNLFIAASIGTVMLFLQAMSTAIWHVVIVRAGLGFAMGGIVPVLYALISKHTPLVRRGGIIGIATSFTILANITGPTSSGYIASHFDIRTAFYLTSAVLAVAVFVIGKWVREPVAPADNENNS